MSFIEYLCLKAKVGIFSALMDLEQNLAGVQPRQPWGHDRKISRAYVTLEDWWNLLDRTNQKSSKNGGLKV